MYNKKNNKVKTICFLGVLTALYVVLSAFLKINIIGNIQIDLGYLAFAVALCQFGPLGTIVGVVGCSLESILFSAYGFSISWAIANLIIGLACGFAFIKVKKTWLMIIVTVLACTVGVLCVKTGIECILYSIPLVVKIPKNAVACGIDFIVMIVGLVFNKELLSRLRFVKY